MKKLLLLLTLTLSSSLYAEANYLEHMQIFNLHESKVAHIDLELNYPGLGGEADCFILSANTVNITLSELKNFSENIVLTNGYSILSGQGTDLKVIKPVVKMHGSITKQLSYSVTDINSYLTGVRIRSLNPYLLLSKLTIDSFGENASNVKLQFFRNCKL